MRESESWLSEAAIFSPSHFEGSDRQKQGVFLPENLRAEAWWQADDLSENLSSEEPVEETDFDLAGFFSTDEAENEEIGAEDVSENSLARTLQESAQAAVTFIPQQVTAENFSRGASLSQGVFSLFGTIVGACGPLCLHGVNALGSATQGTSGFLPNASLGGFNIDDDGTFRLEGNIDDIAQATGISAENLRSGRYSLSELFLGLLGPILGEGVGMAFGFGIFDSLLDVLLPG